MKPKKNFLKDFLEEKYLQYNTHSFIESDPISIPHLFTKKEDIEIAGFFAATIAWGQRKTILKNARLLMQYMDFAPHDFILSFTKNDLSPFNKFTHRTFNGDDCIYFLQALKNIYTNHDGMENLFVKNNSDIIDSILEFRTVFFEMPHQKRTEKHVSNPFSKSACKRLNMFLRWMVRKDKAGVDFGIWKLSPSKLYCPLDIHSGRVARSFGLLNRIQNDWLATDELTRTLRQFDKTDPVKYDYALFGLGVNEKFK